MPRKKKEKQIVIESKNIFKEELEKKFPQNVKQFQDGILKETEIIKEDIQETPIELQSDESPELNININKNNLVDLEEKHIVDGNIEIEEIIAEELSLEDKIKGLSAVEYRNYLRTGILPN